ncbi:OmpA family protein [Alteribacillus iranensis]|uniref:Outer membrane protein OmpA n=1 Tax=Alteribacillus iranensis TaxID=930128 RepID=A0A1I2D1G3_9BACI|nr:OmpA family protein [Alteribacillus iranensis]SFE74332.1 Outer membrane protein OmpA [Alteribacillus iranensis]
MSMKGRLLSIAVIFALTACSEPEEAAPVEEEIPESSEAEEIEEEPKENEEEQQENDEEESSTGTSSFEVSAPDVSAPNVSAPEVSAPEVSAPEVTVSVEDDEITMEVPDHLLFDFDKSTLREDAVNLLEEISGELTEYEMADVKIHGHTDNQGAASYNKKLSEERAQAVKNFFLEQGDLEPFHFTTKGFGEEQPLVPNDNEENREKNRRVEILIKPDDD